jgi:DeoR family suf operon transcriptional repressor
MLLSQTIPGFRGTRAEVLLAVKRSQPVATKELATLLGVTANGLRRHLKELELEGVVAYRREVRGVGGPVFAYSLTDAGERLFPTAYDETLTAALDLVREQLGEEGVVAFFRQRWEQIAERAKPELAGLPLPERTRRLAEMLTALGYMAELSDGDVSTLREHNCTIRSIVERFPEVCAAEQRFIQDVLGVEVTRQAHIAKGANCCEYCIAHQGKAGETTGKPEAAAGAAPQMAETT